MASTTLLAPGLAIMVSVVAGYLLGSIPVADLVVGRRAGPDLRTVGDGNPGYWNTKETLGRRTAVPVFVGDAAKGAVAAGIGLLLAPDGEWWVGYLAAGAAIVGHAWPVFARFRGGRGVLTFAGAVCVLAPIAAAIAIGALLILTAATRSFAWGARVGVFGFPIIQLAVDDRYRTAATGGLMCIIGLRFALAAWTDRSAHATTGGDAPDHPRTH